MSKDPERITLGTRGSALARWQTNWLIERLSEAWPALECRTQVFSTAGDRDQATPLPAIGGKGLFTQDLEAALRSGEIDVAVHSLKDLPVDDAPGVRLGAISERADARDVLVARNGPPPGCASALAGLPPGAVVGTSSLRRAAQLRAARPDLKLEPLRGNVDTRIRKALAGDYDAVVLAAAGLLRLGLGEHIAEYLPFELMLPAPGQGAMAAQCRAGDRETQRLLAAVDHPPTRACVTAERAFLQALGGGCSAPVAAYAQAGQPGETAIRITGLVASADGRRLVRVFAAGDDPLAVGRGLARQALAGGAGDLLA
jgi:hydroxymethylbilane synthase